MGGFLGPIGPGASVRGDFSAEGVLLVRWVSANFDFFRGFFTFLVRFLPVFRPYFALFPSMPCAYLYVSNFFPVSLAWDLRSLQRRDRRERRGGGGGEATRNPECGTRNVECGMKRQNGARLGVSPGRHRRLDWASGAIECRRREAGSATRWAGVGRAVSSAFRSLPAIASAKAGSALRSGVPGNLGKKAPRYYRRALQPGYYFLRRRRKSPPKARRLMVAGSGISWISSTAAPAQSVREA